MDEVLGVVLRAAPSSALVTLIVFAVLAVWRGWLVPRSQVTALLEQTRRVADVQEQRLVESRDREAEWRRAWETSEAARQVLAGHDADLLEAMRTLEALVRALPAARGAPGGSS